MSGVHDQFHKTLAERREQRSAGRARKSVLEDLESRQEALGIGVKEILSRARTARTAPWDKVLGSVSELLEVDLEQAALAEIAPGRRLRPSSSTTSLRWSTISITRRCRLPDASGLSCVAETTGRRKAERVPRDPLSRFLESLELDPAVAARS